MVNSNVISNRRFVMEPRPKGAWKDIQPNFGIIKGLHLEYLEFPSKIKKNAPIIPEPTYSGKAFDDPVKPAPPPEGERDDEEVESETHEKSSSAKSARSGTSSSYGTSSEDDEEDNFLEKFGSTPEKKKGPAKEKSVDDEKQFEEEPAQPKIPKYVVLDKEPVEKEKEIDPQEQYILDEVERRTIIAALKKAQREGMDVGEIPDDLDLQTAKIVRETTSNIAKREGAISMNKFALMGIFLGIDQGVGFFSNKIKGYFEFQMQIINTYDSYLDAIGETSINTFFQQLDPSVQLLGFVSLTTGAFYVFQNFVGEDKLKGAKLIKAFFPGQAKVIDEITEASKKVKADKAKETTTEKVSTTKKKRGPTFKADDVDNM